MIMITFSDAFQRTDLGRHEVKAHAVAMSRPARNLLMIIDASCPARQWVQRVTGSSEADLAALLEAGLIAPCAAAPDASPAAREGRVPSAPVPDPGARPAGSRGGPTLDEALARWTYDGLYTLLTHEAKGRFGLIKGYRLILEVERCPSVVELRTMAKRFVDQLRGSHGEEAAQRFARQLITSAPAVATPAPPKG